MKCQVTSNTIHEVLISKEMSYKSYKEICQGKKKLDIGYNNWVFILRVENGTLHKYPTQNYIFGQEPSMSHPWEVLSAFFSLHNIEPNWLDCKGSYGHYSSDLGGWSGCMGKV